MIWKRWCCKKRRTTEGYRKIKAAIKFTMKPRVKIDRFKGDNDSRSFSSKK